MSSLFCSFLSVNGNKLQKESKQSGQKTMYFISVKELSSPRSGTICIEFAHRHMSQSDGSNGSGGICKIFDSIIL